MAFFGSLLRIVGAGAFFVASVFTLPVAVATALLVGAAVLSYAGYKLDRGPTRDRQTLSTQMFLEPGTPIPVVYGRARVGAVVADWFTHEEEVTPRTFSVLYMALALAHGSRDGQGIADIEEIWLDGSLAVRSPSSTRDYRDPYATGNTDFVKLLGSTSQNFATANLTGLGLPSRTLATAALNSGWVSTDQGRGIAGLVLRLYNYREGQEESGDLVFRGPPVVNAVVRGNRVEDTRTSTWVAGLDNPAMCVRDYLLSPIYGAAVPASMLDADSFEAVADYCDESVDYPVSVTLTSGSVLADVEIVTTDHRRPRTLPITPGSVVITDGTQVITDNGSGVLVGAVGTGGDNTINYATGQASFSFDNTAATPVVLSYDHTAKRFTCNGWLDTSRPVGENLAELLSSCRGQLVWEQGVFKLVVRRVQSTPVMDLNPSNILGGWQFGNAGLKERYNVVEAQYIDPIPETDDAAYRARTVTFPAPGLTNAFLAADNGFENRLTLDLPFTTSHVVAQGICQVLLNESRQGITVALTATEAALQLSVGDLVSVTHPTPDWDAKQFTVEALTINPDSTVGLQLQEYDPAAYDHNVMQDVMTLPDTGLGSVFEVPAVGAVTVASGFGSERIRVSWDPVASGLIDYYEVQARNRDDDDTYRTVARVRPETNAPSATVEGVRNGETWQARVRVVNQVGAAGPWSESAEHVVVVRETAAVTISVTGVEGGAEVRVTDLDANGVGIDALYVDVLAQENTTTGGENPTDADRFGRLTNTMDFVFVPATDGNFVRAQGIPYNRFEERGTASAVVEAQVGGAVGPTAPPSGLTCSSCTGGVSEDQFSIDISWTNGDASSQTRVFLNAALVATLAAGTSSTTVTATPGGTHVVGIAHFEGGVQLPATPITIVVQTPAAVLGQPTNLATQTVDPASVKLTWQPGTPNLADQVYRIEREPSGGGGFTLVATTGAGATSYTHEDWPNATDQYTFRVRAERSGWTASSYASTSGTYGIGASINSVAYLYDTVLCSGGVGGTLSGCPGPGNRHLIRWTATGPAGYTIELRKATGVGGFVSQVTGLSLTNQPVCGTTGTHAAAWVQLMAGLFGVSFGEQTQWEVQLRDGANQLVDSMTTAALNEQGAPCGEEF